jgi:hypothetical protein
VDNLEKLANKKQAVFNRLLSFFPDWFGRRVVEK